MIDRELVTRKATLILRDVEALKPLGELTQDEFLSSTTRQVLAERYLERVIGRMIDVNYHVLIESGEAPPPDYYESFLRLAPLGVYPSDFARRVASSAGLRNRLVHQYDEIDPVLLHEAVRSALRDVPEYLRAVQKFIPNH